MNTIVRILGREARLTPEGWRTGDPELDRLCEEVTSGASCGGLYHPHVEQAQADYLAERLGGTVLSVAPPESSEDVGGQIY